MTQRLRDERGQAAVEFVAVLPFLMLAALVAWQFVLVGHVAWDVAGAARSGARAAVVGQDSYAAAKSAMPPPLRPDLKVSDVGAHGVRVSVPVPLIVYRWRMPVRISATASLGS